MKQRKIKVKGKVVKGIGKGSFFLSLEPYKSFFKGLLGREPYLGTLNVELPNDWDKILSLPNEYRPAGYGGILYAIGDLQGIKVIVIRPQKSKHPKKIIELVSDRCLRESLKISNGKMIEIDVYL
ncbi:MAG: DUF120 domain-containing protein [Candidatus Njordarchaeia archaeon]